MPFPRKRHALQFTEQEQHKLESIRKSRTEEKRRTLRAAILLDSLAGQSDETIARHHHVSRGTVVLCVQKCLRSSVWTQRWENCPGQASRGNCRTTRLPGCRIVLARSRRN